MFWLTLIYLTSLLVVLKTAMFVFRTGFDKDRWSNPEGHPPTLENFIKSDEFFYFGIMGVIPLVNTVSATGIGTYLFFSRLWNTKLVQRILKRKL